MFYWCAGSKGLHHSDGLTSLHLRPSTACLPTLKAWPPCTSSTWSCRRSPACCCCPPRSWSLCTGPPGALLLNQALALGAPSRPMLLELTAGVGLSFSISVGPTWSNFDARKQSHQQSHGKINKHKYMAEHDKLMNIIKITIKSQINENNVAWMSLIKITI